MKECIKVNEIIFDLYKKILIIEHDKEYNTNLYNKLDKFDYIINSSTNYEQTTKLLKEDKYDYIIVNLDSDTSEHNELLNFLKITTDSKIMVLSDNLDTQYKEYLYFNGIVKFLQKSQTIDEIVEIINGTITSISSRFILNDILLVQNSPFVVEQINNLLVSRGYNIITKSCNDSIDQILEEKDITLILLDLEMSCIDPILLLNKIKSNEKNKHIPILVLSTHN